MTTPESQSARPSDQLPILDPPDEIATLRSTGFHLLLETGKPGAIAEWAQQSGTDQARMEIILESPACKAESSSMTGEGSSASPG